MPAPPQLPPDLAQRYRIVGSLGAGAMGTVYRAQDLRAGREVALKLLNATGEAQRARFQREGEITAGLVHPHVVRVFSSGVSGQVPWLAYELVPGARPLDVAFEGLDLRARVALLGEVAEALAYAHERGVVHRDVKPENVLVDISGRARLSDFGLAKALDTERLTKTGALLGTPAFMAPEQVSGASAAGAPADVWALGVILYLALTDALPFEGESLIQLGARICQGDFQRPRERDPKLPRELEDVCLHALQLDAGARYPDAGAFAADVQAWLAGRRPVASSTAVGGALRSERRRGAALGAGLAALLGLGALAFVAADSPGAGQDAAAGTPSATRGPTRAELSPLERLRRLARLEQPAEVARLRALGQESAEVRALARELAQAPLFSLEPPGRGEAAVAFWEQQLVVARSGLLWFDSSRLSEPTRVLELPHSTLSLVSLGGGAWLTDGPALYDPARPDELRTPLGPRKERALWLVAATPRGRWLAAGIGAEVVLIDGETLKPTGPKLSFHPDPAQALALDPRGELLFVGGGQRLDSGRAGNPGFVRAYRVPSLELAWEAVAPPRVESLLAFDEALVVGCTAGDLFELDRGGGRGRVYVAPKETMSRRSDAQFRIARAHQGTVCDLQRAPDPRLLVSGAREPGLEGATSEIRLWDRGSGEQIGWLLIKGIAVTSVALDQERRLVAVGARGGAVQLWSLDALESAR